MLLVELIFSVKSLLTRGSLSLSLPLLLIFSLPVFLPPSLPSTLPPFLRAVEFEERKHCRIGQHLFVFEVDHSLENFAQGPLKY